MIIPVIIDNKSVFWLKAPFRPLNAFIKLPEPPKKVLNVSKNLKEIQNHFGIASNL